MLHRHPIRALALVPILVYVLVIPMGCGGSGGGGGNPGLSEVPPPHENTLYPDLASTVFQGGVLPVALFGDAAGLGPVDDDVRAVFRFSLEGHIPADSTILSAKLVCHVTEKVGQVSDVMPALFESRAIGINSLFTPNDVLVGVWGPATEVASPTPTGVNQPDRWEFTDEGGVGIANTIQTIVGPMSANGLLSNDLLVRVRGTPNLSGSSDQMRLGGPYAPTNASYTVLLKVRYHPPAL